MVVEPIVVKTVSNKTLSVEKVKLSFEKLIGFLHEKDSTESTAKISIYIIFFITLCLQRYIRKIRKFILFLKNIVVLNKITKFAIRKRIITKLKYIKK